MAHMDGEVASSVGGTLKVGAGNQSVFRCNST